MPKFCNLILRHFWPCAPHRYAFSNPVNTTDPSGLMPPINAGPRLGMGYSAATRQAMYRHFIQNSQSYAPTAPTQVSPQARYAAQVRRPGFNSTALSRPDGGIPRVQVARSVNTAGWQTTNDPLARQQSRERSIRACGLSDLLTGFAQAGLNGQLIPTLFDFAMHVPELARPLMMMSSEDWLRAFHSQPGWLGGFQVLTGNPVGWLTLLEQVSWEAVGEFFSGQIEDLKAMWQPGDWRMWASLGIGLSTTLIAAGVGAVLVGAAIPAVVAGSIILTVGAGAVLANTAFNTWIYNRWDTFGADLAGDGVEMAFGIAGGSIGGPVGWLIGSVIGAGVGQITSNVLSGESWYRGLLGSMLISGVADGVGGAIGHAAGSKLRGDFDVDAPSRPKLGDHNSQASNPGEVGPHRTFSPEMEAGLAILEKYKPEYADLIRRGVIPLEEGPKVGVSGGISLADRIIVSTDARYPLSTAATLYEEIYHTFQGPGYEQIIELEAKAAKAKWVLGVAEESGLEFNRFPAASGDILAFESGGIAGLRDWLSAEYGNNLKDAGMLYGKELCSFGAETSVATEDGVQPISELTVGDQVLAYNETLGLTDFYPVVAIWVHKDAIIEHLTVDGETIKTTPDHPFFTQENEWVPAGILQDGDYIRKADGSYGEVQIVTFVNNPQPMYNLTVAEAHTYFVGDGQWLVHNHCNPLHTAALEFHSHLDLIARKMRTTAVLRGVDQDGNMVTLVASSEPKLSRAQIQAVTEAGAIPISGPPGKMHAEQRALLYAKFLGIESLAVAASRDICPVCTQWIEAAGAIAASPLE